MQRELPISGLIAAAVACLLWLVSAPAGQPGAASRPTADRRQADEAEVVRLIQQLGADSYRQREQASERLREMGASIAPILNRHRDHADLEVAIRVAKLLKDYEWMGRGAMVIWVGPDGQAKQLGFRIGDVVLKVNDVDIKGHEDISAELQADRRTMQLWRQGKIVQRVVVRGKKADFSVSSWELARGGAEQSRGMLALSEKRYEEAYQHLRAAWRKGLADVWSLERLVGLTESRLDHKQAMRVYARARRELAKDSCAWSHQLVDKRRAGLPFSGAHTAWLLQRDGREGFSSDLWHQMCDYFIDGGRNLPLARKIAARKWPNAGRERHRFWRDYTRLKIAFHERRWEDVLKGYEAVKDDPYPAREAVMAAVHAGKVRQACSIAMKLLDAYEKGNFGSKDAAYCMTAAAAAAAAGREELARPILNRLRRLKPADQDAILGDDVHFLYSHAAVRPMMTPYLRQLLRPNSRADRGVGYVYLDTLRFSPACRLQPWRASLSRFGSEKPFGKYVHWVNAECLLRLGRYDQAKQAVKEFFPEYWGLDAFHRAADFLAAHADRLETDWAALKGVIQVFDGRETGSRWAVRWDGRTFHLDRAGKIHEYPGLAPGEIHRGIAGGCIMSLPTGTIYFRRSQIYLLDEKARRWLPTFAAPCRVPAYRNALDDAAGPVLLKYLLKHYPAAGPGRELMFREIAPGGWRLYQINGDRAVAVHPKSLRLINLSEEIARLAGRAEPAAVYRTAAKEDYRRALIPTDCGLWLMDAEGKLSRARLGLEEPNVICSILAWPKREGKKYIGVAPQHGGQVFEFDMKTGQIKLTAGYCGLGPCDSYHWFMHGRREKRFVLCEYAIQALYEKRLASEGK